MAVAIEPRSKTTDDRAAALRLIDTDVHNDLPSVQELKPFLPAEWHPWLDNGGPGMAGRYYANMGSGRMDDAVREEDGLAAGDPDWVVQQLMTKYRIDLGVLTGSIIGVAIQHDWRFQTALVSAYNDWTLESWVGEYPDRFMACGLVPLWDPQLMAEEVARLAARGCHAVTFSEEPSKLGLPSLYSEHWDPFWAACEANEVVVCFHLGSSSSMPVTAPGAPYEATSALAPTSLLYTATDLVWAYFLRKYPNLKVALTEGGIGWIPYFLERTDWVYLRHHHWTGTDFGDRLPSDVFRDQVITCFIEDSAGLALRDRIGVDMICWEMDYPHADCTWPAGPESFAGSIAQLSREEADKITHLNAMRLFHFDPFSRRSRESSTVGALRALAGDVDLSYHHNEQVQGRGPVHATADMLASSFVSN